MKSFSDKSRQIAGVVYVGVRDQNGVDRSRIKRWFLPIALAQFLQPLEHATVDEHARVVCFNQILRSGNRPHAAPERKCIQEASSVAVTAPYSTPTANSRFVRE